MVARSIQFAIIIFVKHSHLNMVCEVSIVPGLNRRVHKVVPGQPIKRRSLQIHNAGIFTTNRSISVFIPHIFISPLRVVNRDIHGIIRFHHEVICTCIKHLNLHTCSHNIQIPCDAIIKKAGFALAITIYSNQGDNLFNIQDRSKFDTVIGMGKSAFLIVYDPKIVVASNNGKGISICG